MFPSIFSSESTITLSYVPGFTASFAQFNPVPLTNNLRIPIEISEIRVTVDSRPITPSDPATTVGAAGFIFLDGKFGKDSITNGAVPISIMAPYRLAEDSGVQYNIENSLVALGQTRRIILPKPLVLLPGKGFSFTAIMPTSAFFTTPAPFPSPFNVVVSVTIVGRYMLPTDRIPMMNEVPMISYVQLTQNNRISLENDLANPLKKPLTIHRLVGAVILRDDTELRSTVTSNGTTIEIRYPNSDRVCEDPMDFVHGIFGGQMRVWPSNFEMPAATRVRADLGVNALDGPVPLQGYQIGLFGTRPEVNP